jgi:hypothetical protein
MKTSTRFFILFIFSIIGFTMVNGQQIVKIDHLSGPKLYKGISVNVTSKGKIETLQYCGDDTGPYYLGYNYANPQCGDGSYTFSFSQPVSEITVNLSALSHSGSYDEEARFYINGVHVNVTNLGTPNGCGEGLCILTSEGNVLPCRDCSGSGVNGLKFKGEIKTFTIECKIISGEPMGFVAGIWFNAKPVENEVTLVNYSLKYEESTAGPTKLVVIEGDLENAILTITDKNGMRYPLFYRTVEKNRIVLDLCDLRKGEFNLEIKNGDKIENQKLLIL